MGIVKKKKIVKIEKLGKTDAIIKTDGLLTNSEMCDLLLGALCTTIKTCSGGNDEYLAMYKRAVIQQIEKIK